MVVSTQVEALEEPATPKPMPLVLLELGVGIQVTLIDSITHASEIFKTLDTIFKDTPIIERPEFQLVFMVKLLILQVNNLLMI